MKIFNFCRKGKEATRYKSIDLHDGRWGVFDSVSGELVNEVNGETVRIPEVWAYEKANQLNKDQ